MNIKYIPVCYHCDFRKWRNRLVFTFLILNPWSAAWKQSSVKRLPVSYANKLSCAQKLHITFPCCTNCCGMVTQQWILNHFAYSGAKWLRSDHWELNENIPLLEQVHEKLPIRAVDHPPGGHWMPHNKKAESPCICPKNYLNSYTILPPSISKWILYKPEKSFCTIKLLRFGRFSIATIGDNFLYTSCLCYALLF